MSSSMCSFRFGASVISCLRFTYSVFVISLIALSPRTTAVSAMSTAPSKIIDSHLHVWATAQESLRSFPYVQDPPESLRDKGSVDELLQHMRESGVDGALIVQPINYKYDHSYVIQALQTHPDKFKGMLLHDPSLDEEEAIARLEELALKGFVGVRYNPYLWPQVAEMKWAPMSEGTGLSIFKRCGELRIPVGVMCFKGLSLHYDDIIQLISASPETTLVLDHFGFTFMDDPHSFEQLLKLSKYPQVIVKISALFRLKDRSPFENVYKDRFLPLLDAFGSDRLMFGSDFPYVLEQPESYAGMLQLVSSWVKEDKDRSEILGGTAERVFGKWGASCSSSIQS